MKNTDNTASFSVVSFGCTPRSIHYTQFIYTYITAQRSLNTLDLFTGHFQGAPVLQVSESIYISLGFYFIFGAVLVAGHDNMFSLLCINIRKVNKPKMSV